MNPTFEIYLQNFSQLELIKEGGQKKVFLGNHNTRGKLIIKVGAFESIVGLERIKREIDFLKKIDSKYYPKNYDFLVDMTQKEFLIIEEYVPCISYTEVQKYYNEEIKIIDLLKKLIDALSLLWSNDIVHRDLKPDNILFLEDFQPRIIDLGIARFLNMSSLTKTFALRGPCTPIYAAPEQLRNEKNIIDVRTDLFAIGIILLELIHGYHPFHPDKILNDYSITENILSGTYVKPVESDKISKKFCFLINKLLQPQQFKRFRTHLLLQNYINENW